MGRTTLLYGVKIPENILNTIDYYEDIVTNFYQKKAITISPLKSTRRYNYVIEFDNINIAIYCLFYRKRHIFFGFKNTSVSFRNGGFASLNQIFPHDFQTEIQDIIEICKDFGYHINIKDFKYYTHTDTNC